MSTLTLAIPPVREIFEVWAGLAVECDNEHTVQLMCLAFLFSLRNPLISAQSIPASNNKNKKTKSGTVWPSKVGRIVTQRYFHVLPALFLCHSALSNQIPQKRELHKGISPNLSLGRNISALISLYQFTDSYSYIYYFENTCSSLNLNVSHCFLSQKEN